MVRTVKVRLLAVLGICFFISCSSTPKNTHFISEVMVGQIKVRRPPSVSAHPDSVPGGVDYESNPRPDQQYDCKDPSVLLSGVQLKALRSCLFALQKSSTQAPLSFEYRLIRQTTPVWLLQEDSDSEKPPSCLKQVLAEISVPREIFFQAKEKDHSCFSAGIDLEASKVLGIELSKNKLSLILNFPMNSLPQSDDETRRMLLSWALTPFFSEDSPRTIASRAVADSICKKCFGSTPLYQDSSESPPPIYWP